MSYSSTKSKNKTNLKGFICSIDSVESESHSSDPFFFIKQRKNYTKNAGKVFEGNDDGGHIGTH